MKQRMRHPAVRIVLLTALLAGVQTGFAVFTARWLGPSDRGVFTIAAAIASFSMLAGSFGVYTGGRVLLSTPSSRFGFGEYRRVVGVLVALQVLIIVGVSMPVWHLLTGIDDPTAFMVFGIYCALMALASLAREGVHGLGKHLLATLSDVAAATVQISLAVALYFMDEVTVASLLGCGVIGFLTQCTICNFGGRERSGRRQASRSSLTGTLKMTYQVVLFSLPGLVLAIGQLFIQKGDRLILGIFSHPREVGIYAAGATIADAAWILPASLSVIVVRQVAMTGSLEPLRRWRPAILGMTLLLSLLLAVSGSTLIHVLLGKNYGGATPILLILCVGSTLFASQQVDIAACNGAGRLEVGAKVTAWGVLTLIVLSVALIPAYQGIGAAAASIGAYACMAALARKAVRRVERESTAGGLGAEIDLVVPRSGGQETSIRTDLGL